MGCDESSSSRRNKTSSSGRCVKCKASGSASKVASRRRRKSSTHTRYSNMVEVQKPLCSRSAHSGFYSTGVTQIYPRFKEIDSIVLTGLATMAARGEKIQGFGPMAAREERVQWGNKVQCECGHTCHTPKLFKHSAIMTAQTTNQAPLPTQVAHHIPMSNGKNDPNKKKKSLKSRFKKLISSSVESKRHAEERQGETSKSSSLTLSSSSSDSHSSASVDAYKGKHPGKCIYPTILSITDNHIPKSPSAKTRHSVSRHKKTMASSSSTSLTSSTAAEKKLSRWNV